ncbi:hypothetical protein AC792_05845 [Arthrobacter sp. RIT-PI-e]|uniref:DUF7793 family protein n=1 Tax=Arthrobacter sp. RIT-PI-e TaxID=1681197 RepID=UPI0006762CB9|nr:hypothetical protein [Arthrobacter sp. RIT-PI-e]KNC19532.1 hypothetical protein AC792_05845 [Arthrobacter sp. RIT-PI-e]
MVQQGTRTRYKLEDAGDYVRLTWCPKITIEARDVVAATAAITELSPERSRPLVMSIGVAEHITPDARRLLIRNVSSSRTAIIGQDDVGRVLTAFAHRSVTPTRYFTDDEEALGWVLDDTGEYSSVFGESYGVQKAFTSQMLDGVLRVRWTQPFHIDAAIAQNIVLRAEFMNPTSCPPMLLELREVMSATDKAMRILADGLNIAALAVVSTDPRGKRLIASYKQRAYPPPPPRHFNTVKQAEHWVHLTPEP